MQDKIHEIFKLFIISLLFSLLPGLFAASIYVTMKDGFSTDLLEQISFFAFWYETPFVTGDVSATFMSGLKVMGSVSGVTVLGAMAVLYRPVKDHHGTARWARNDELVKAGYARKYDQVTGPIFGKMAKPKSNGYYLSNGPHAHSIVAAPTRAGKGVGVVIPTLLTFNGSTIVLDVKGELFEMTSRARQTRGDRIFKFSPIDPQGRTHRYNPIDDIMNAAEDRKFLEARRLAANLVVAKNKGAEGFLDGARDLFVAGVMAVIERGTPTIGAVYDLFSLPGEKYKLFAQLAEETQNPDARRIFDNMAGNDTKILTSYTSVLGDGGLNLWADQLVKNATNASDFSIYDLRRDPTSIYIVVSPNDLEVLSPLVRLLFQQIVSVLQRTLPEKDETFEVLFLLDEFKHLGKMSAIETAITTIAGYMGRFMFVVQTLSAFTENYEQTGKENFLGNTGVQVFMATADSETPEYISKAIGDFTYIARSKSWQNYEMLKSNIQESEQGSRLIRPEQIRLLNDDMEIVLVKGQPPLMIHKVKYYEDKILKKLFDAQTGPLPEPDAIINPPRIPVPLASAASAHEDGLEDKQPDEGDLDGSADAQDAGNDDSGEDLSGEDLEIKAPVIIATQNEEGMATGMHPVLTPGQQADANARLQAEDDYPDFNQSMDDDVPDDASFSEAAFAGEDDIGDDNIGEDKAAQVAMTAQAELLEKIKRLQSGLRTK
jgi:type IV secretion system protein VirD4